jgi:modulator of FtsH protease HflK
MAEIFHSRQAAPPTPDTPLDAGSRALSEALRSSFAIVKFVMAILALVFLASGFFTVGPEQRAIILRFGKPRGEGQGALLGPGLHWSFPYPIDECVKVSITGIQQVRSTAGWYAVTPVQEAAHTEPPAGPSLNPQVDGFVITADNNIIHARATLSYRISDPIRYVFEFVNASNAVQSALDDALLYTAAHFTVDDILTRERLSFQEALRKRVTDLATSQDLGVVVEQCAVECIRPRQLKDAFDNVIKAEVNRSKALNEARSDEIKVLSKAAANAFSITNTAASDRTNLVAEVSGLARQFEDLLPIYRQAPDLYLQQRLDETLGRVFAKAQEKIFVTGNPDGRAKEVRLLLNREPPKKPEETKR